MSLDQLINQASNEPKETSKGERIQIVEVAPTSDEHELVSCHHQGKLLKKEGEAQFGRARRLYNKVIQSLLANRASERPKQFKFKTDICGEDYTATINVRENGYSSIDNDTLAKVKAIVGDEFVSSYITTHIEGKVDFSLVPTDKQDAVAAHLLQLNQLVGTDIVQVNVTNKPKTSFHEARASLSEETDALLNKHMPITCAFGR